MKFFSLSGRATRGEWWGVNVFAFIASVIIFVCFFADMISDLESSDEMEVETICKAAGGLLITGLIFAIATFAVTIRRLHDRGHSGWILIIYWVCSCIPFVNIVSGLIYFLDVGCVDGMPGPNQYGEDPKGRRGVYSHDQIVVNVEKPLKDVEARLVQLDRLKAAGTLSEDEYAKQRSKVISEI